VNRRDFWSSGGHKSIVRVSSNWTANSGKILEIIFYQQVSPFDRPTPGAPWTFLEVIGKIPYLVSLGSMSCSRCLSTRWINGLLQAKGQFAIALQNTLTEARREMRSLSGLRLPHWNEKCNGRRWGRAPRETSARLLQKHSPEPCK
jgi:hypothetical protein